MDNNKYLKKWRLVYFSHTQFLGFKGVQSIKGRKFNKYFANTEEGLGKRRRRLHGDGLPRRRHLHGRRTGSDSLPVPPSREFQNKMGEICI